MTIPAKYENGVFRPLAAVHIKEGTVVEVRVPNNQNPPASKISIRDLPLFGMWKDREDIGAGVEFVDRLRDNPRGWRDMASYLVDTDVLIDISRAETRPPPRTWMLLVIRQ